MQHKLVVRDLVVMGGKPVIAGTRITVELILEKLAAGESVEPILEAHPMLTREGIRAVLAFAAEALRADVAYPLAEATQKSVADEEGVDRQIVDRLRHDGRQVSYVAEMQPGIPDGVVLDLANREDALLVTADKDSGELVYRERRSMTRIILIRLAGLAPTAKAEIVASAIQEHAGQLPGSFAVIVPKAIRIRRRDT